MAQGLILHSKVVLFVFILKATYRDAAGRHGSGREIGNFSRAGSVGSANLKMPRVGSGHGSAKNFPTGHGSKGKMVRVRRVKSRKFTGHTGQTFFIKVCNFFYLINIDLTKNRHFRPKSFRFCENISRKHITGNAGQEQFFSQV